MTYSRVRYHATVPPSEVQVYVSAHEAGLDESNQTQSVRARALTKWTYFLLGCAIMLPWNALMNGTSFFLARLVGSPFYATFGSYFASVFMLAKLMSQFYCTFTSNQSSPSRRVFVSINAGILLLLSLCVSTFIQSTPSAFFVFVMFISASLAATAGCMCTAVYAVASLLGVSFLQAVLSGHAAVAVAVSAVQLASSVISLWSSSPKSAHVMESGSGTNQAEELAARIFFSVSAAFLCITLAAYTWLTRQPFYKSFTKVLEQRGQVGNPDELTGLVADVYEHPSTEANSRIYHVLRQNWVFMFSIAYTFTVTLAVFPAVTVRVQPVSSVIHPMLFTAIHFLVYNIGDLFGRYFIPCTSVWSVNKILAISLLRTLFIPLILLCNVHSSTATVSLVSPIINSDILYMIILLTMGYTNGYAAAMATVAASSLEHNPGLEGDRKNVDVVATLCASFAIAGLTIGALCSFVVQAMV